jgi:sugar fermentation stimulation protein A
MKYQKIKEAVFLSRPNRFTAYVTIDGVRQAVHVKNTGRCRELLYEGAKVYLEDRRENRKERKTEYSLIAVEKGASGTVSGARLVNIDSQAPNKVVGEALAGGRILLPGLSYPLTKIKPEAVYEASRFDFYVEDAAGKEAYIEVKGATLEIDGAARFPDAPTERGIKHIRELCHALDHGIAAYMIFVIQMNGVRYFEPNDETPSGVRRSAAGGI